MLQLRRASFVCCIKSTRDVQRNAEVVRQIRSASDAPGVQWPAGCNNYRTESTGERKEDCAKRSQSGRFPNTWNHSCCWTLVIVLLHYYCLS